MSEWTEEKLRSRIRELEALAAESTKRERRAVARLAGGVAHQFNNLLARILACAEDASERDLDPVAARNMRTIIDACEEAGRIAECLLGYAGIRPLSRKTVNPLNIIEHVLQMLDERLRGAGVEVVRSYGAVPDMLLDYVRMGEVFTNLVTNAMDAMPRGGRLHVECRTEAGELVVKVSDTGAGIPPEVLDSVFLPFVTTKGAMSGSDLPGRGLALCVCQGVVAGHNGTISVESEPGQGAVFTIRLPVERPIDGLVAEGPLGPELVAEGPVESAEGT